MMPHDRPVFSVSKCSCSMRPRRSFYVWPSASDSVGMKTKFAAEDGYY